MRNRYIVVGEKDGIQPFVAVSDRTHVFSLHDATNFHKDLSTLWAYLGFHYHVEPVPSGMCLKEWAKIKGYRIATGG